MGQGYGPFKRISNGLHRNQALKRSLTRAALLAHVLYDILFYIYRRIDPICYKIIPKRSLNKLFKMARIESSLNGL